MREKGKQATLSGNYALDVFRKRSSVSAFRIAALCQYLYQMESPSITSESNSDRAMSIVSDSIRRFVKQIYLFMAEYILQNMLDRWGVKFEVLNDKREAESKTGPKESIFDQLTDTFTREQLNLLIEQQGKSTPDKVFLSRWRKLKVIEFIDKNTFRKVNS